MAETSTTDAAEETTEESTTTEETTQESSTTEETTESSSEETTEETNPDGEGEKSSSENSFSGKIENYVSRQKDKDGKPLDDVAKKKLSNRLARYASDEAVFDAMINAQNKISAGGLVKIPGKDATKEEIAQYRAEIGVPEDPKGYDLSLDNGLVIGDADKPMIDEFLTAAHESGYNQQQVTDGLNWFFTAQENAVAERYAADAAQKSDAEEELRAEWGPEYKANRNLMANYLGSDFNEGVAELITGARLADGTPLANHPEILRGFVAKARAANPLGALVPGTGTKQHDQMVTEIETLEKKMGEGSLKGKDQDRYLKLVSMRDKIPEK